MRQGANYYVQIGRSFFDRRKLYEIAEELIGEEIMDHTTDLPLKRHLGKKISFDVFKSPKPDMPVAVTVRGTGDVYYLLTPMVGDG